MITLLNWILTWLKNVNPLVSSGLVFTTSFLVLWQMFVDSYHTLLAKIDTLAAGATGGAANFSPLGLADAVFPLTELLNFLVALMAIRLICATIRIVKSFVPSIA